MLEELDDARRARGSPRCSSALRRECLSTSSASSGAHDSSPSSGHEVSPFAPRSSGSAAARDLHVFDRRPDRPVGEARRHHVAWIQLAADRTRRPRIVQGERVAALELTFDVIGAEQADAMRSDLVRLAVERRRRERADPLRARGQMSRCTASTCLGASAASRSAHVVTRVPVTLQLLECAPAESVPRCIVSGRCIDETLVGPPADRPCPARSPTPTTMRPGRRAPGRIRSV